MLAVLNLDFLTVIGKVFPEKSTLQMSEILLVVYYLQAIVILKHAPRVGVTGMMTVSINYLLDLLTCFFIIRFMKKYFWNR